MPEVGRDESLASAGADCGLAGRLVRSRVVILPVAVATVAAALLVGWLV